MEQLSLAEFENNLHEMDRRGYQDPQTLRTLYNQEGLSTYEIAEEFGVTQNTIRYWMDKHDINSQPPPGDGDPDWQNEKILRDLIENRGLSGREVADRLGCSKSTVNHWRNEYDIIGKQSNRDKPPHFGTYDGYEIIYHHDGMANQQVRVHRLVAVAEFGFDAIVDQIIHHKNGIPWDNRPCNLVPMDNESHTMQHAKDRVRRENEGEPDWWNKKKMRELYIGNDMTTVEIAEELGCHQVTVWERLDDFGLIEEKKDRIPWRNKEKLQSLYIEDGCTTKEIADKFGCSRQTVGNWLRRFELK